MKPLIVVPSSREGRALGPRVKPFIAGSGEEAREELRLHLRHERPDAVLIAGYCGGLDPSLKAGSIILCRHVITAGHDAIEPDRLVADEVRAALRQRHLPFVYSRLLTVGEPTATKSAKRDLWNEHGAGAVDMETYALARAAANAGIPWMAVRVVIDSSKQALPASLARWSQPGDERRAMLEAALHPLDWPKYARLAFQMPRANRALRRGTLAVAAAMRDVKTVETLELMEVGR